MARHAAYIAGIETAYLDTGCGQTIVALHGIPTSSALFEPLLPFLGGYRLIAPDLLGQGATRSPDGKSLGHAAYAEHLREFLEVVPPRLFHLLVHDLGGLLGLDWAVVRPERVKSLIILSTIGYWTFGRAAVRLARYGLNLFAGPAAIRAAIRSALKRGDAISSDLLNDWARPWTRRRLFRGIDHYNRIHCERLSQHLGSLRLPCLVLRGAEDDVFPIHHAERIRALLPHARFVSVPEVGHFSPLEAPERLAKEITAFLDSLPP